MKWFQSEGDRNKALLLAGAGIIAVLSGYLLLRTYVPIVFQPTALRSWIAQFGLYAPFVFILVQALQVIVAPIPGQVVALVAGYLFGSVAGTIYSITGVLIGSAVAFSLAKRFGRPFVENTLSEDVIERFDSFVATVGLPGLFVFVIIPGLPDDAVCFLSGLTTWRLRTFMTIIAVGRLPAYVVTVYAGGELANAQYVQATLLITLVATLSVVGYYKQEAIRDIINSLEPRLPF
jgi:Uncharacterized conserved protein